MIRDSRIIKYSKRIEGLYTQRSMADHEAMRRIMHVHLHRLSFVWQHVVTAGAINGSAKVGGKL